MIWPHLLGILLLLTLIAVMVFFVSEALRNMSHRSREEEEQEMLRQFGEDFSEFLREFRHLIREVGEIRDSLKRPLLFPIRAEVLIMPKTVDVGGTAQATLNVLDQFGNPFTLDGSYTVTYQGSNPAAATFGTPNPDGSDTITATSAEPSDTITATIAGGPAGVSISAVGDTLTVNAAPVPVPTSASVVLS